MKHIKLFEDYNRLFEHHLGLKNFNTSPEYTKIWKECKSIEKDYLTKKGLSKEVVDYLTRIDNNSEHQENIQIPWIYNEKILNEFEFTFKEGISNTKEIYPFLSKKTITERESKWAKSIQTGVEYFKGRKVEGNTPEERKVFLEETTKKWLKIPDKSKPVCIEKPWNNNKSWIVIDGGHRLWCAMNLFPEGIDLYMIKVYEKAIRKQ